MNNNTSKISIIIIGFNTKMTLLALLDSINNILCDTNNIEVVYIDDGSKDDSLVIFQKYNLQFQKTFFKFDENRGRVLARQKGVELASNGWLLFLNSNVIVTPNIIKEYQQAIIKNKVVAIGGKIEYLSQDKKLETYLNNKNRGLNKYRQYDIMEYSYLLFGNCLIKKDVFKGVPLNLKLKYYGGEELDFSYRLSKKYFGKIIACNSALVKRINHPVLVNHCLRLEEFGEYNFPLLDQKLKQNIIKYAFLLKHNKMLLCLILILNKFSLSLYRLELGSFVLIRASMLTAILRGYYRQIK